MRGHVLRLGGLILAATPLLVLTSPVLLFRFAGARRRRGAAGYRVLPVLLARTVAHYAEAMIRAEAPAGGWSAVARGLDGYLAGTHSPRAWRILALLALMEVAPVLVLERPFGLLSRNQRRAFVDRRLEAPEGLFRLVAAGGQLMRLGYYARPEASRRLGSLPLTERTARRALRRRPVAAECVA